MVGAPVSTVSAAMPESLLSIVRYRTSGSIHSIMPATVVMMAFGHLMFYNRAMLMHTAMVCLSGTEADVQTGCLRLTTEGEHRNAGDNGISGNVFFHGLCLGSCRASCPVHQSSAQQKAFYLIFSNFIKKKVLKGPEPSRHRTF